MKTPGFTAEASLYKIHGAYACSATNGYNKRAREVVSQLKGGVFHRPLGGGVFGTV